MAQFLLFSLLVIISSPTTTSTSNSDNCTQVCGSTRVPYPLGFSPGCKIPLTCATASHVPKIGDFSIRNVSSDRILLDVPPSCRRPLDSVSPLFARNHALTARNGLFLRGCGGSNSSLLGCSISTDLISDHLDLLRCAGAGKSDNVSCYAHVAAGEGGSRGNGGRGGFLAPEGILATGCESLFTAVSYEAEGNLTALVFSTVEVGWWVDGNCSCSANANCTRVVPPVGGRDGYRCECDEGYEGDGFADGRGCVKVSHCGSSSKCNRSTKTGVLAGVITAGGSIMVGIAFCIYLIRRRCSSSKSQKNTKRLLSEASFNVPFYPYKTIERATGNFDDTHRLGTGAYGTVYVGNLSNGEHIAVKKIKHPDPETIEQVMNEVKMISSVNHPNLARLLGCCIDRGEQILVYEFMPNGTLAQHLQRQRGPGLPWTIRLAIATEAAKALAYLHSAVHPPIYHRDIKSSNILLDRQFNAKIADFGLSRAIVTDSSHVSTAPQGTPGYVDPQYHQNYHLSDKSDVYSFGVVLMEIITAMKVVDFNRVQTEVNLAALAVDRIAKGRVEEIIDPFLDVQRETWTFVSVHKVAELAFRCLAFHRDMRPSMMEVADELEQIRQSSWAPKDGEVELCSLPLVKSASDGNKIEGKSKRLVFVSARAEDKVNSPVSVQDNWVSEQSTPSSSSLLGYSNRH